MHVFREYLREKEKFRETVFAWSYWKTGAFFILKKYRKSRTLFLNYKFEKIFFFTDFESDSMIAFM